MTERIDFICEVCGEDFTVPRVLYDAHSGVVQCPLCGSHDLVLIVYDDEVAGRPRRGAAA